MVGGCRRALVYPALPRNAPEGWECAAWAFTGCGFRCRASARPFVNGSSRVQLCQFCQFSHFSASFPTCARGQPAWGVTTGSRMHICHIDNRVRARKWENWRESRCSGAPSACGVRRSGCTHPCYSRRPVLVSGLLRFLRPHPGEVIVWMRRREIGVSRSSPPYESQGAPCRIFVASLE